MAAIESVAVFGCTGSVGVNTLDVIERNCDRYCVAALCANRNVDLLLEQCTKFKPQVAAMADAGAAQELARRLQATGNNVTKVLQHESALEDIAADPRYPIVMAAIVGFAGLRPTMAAALAGKRILLANKESMVVAGVLLTAAAVENGATIVPVDSEHNAIFQCLPDSILQQQKTQNVPLVGTGGGIDSLVLTASGGPFRSWSKARMETATVSEAVNHPNWSMGAKISVDSATMMNKGLEIIEACYLFGVDESQIEVVVHPQSVIHSMVRYRDGSVLAQLGQPDMRTPIAHALAWPDRIDAGVRPLDFQALSGLDFEHPDEDRFPCLALAREAMRMGGAANGVLNAANEVAVERFLAGHIGFADIARVNANALHNFSCNGATNIEELHTIDQGARLHAHSYIDDVISAALTTDADNR